MMRWMDHRNSEMTIERNRIRTRGLYLKSYLSHAVQACVPKGNGLDFCCTHTCICMYICSLNLYVDHVSSVPWQKRKTACEREERKRNVVYGSSHPSPSHHRFSIGAHDSFVNWMLPGFQLGEHLRILWPEYLTHKAAEWARSHVFH